MGFAISDDERTARLTSISEFTARARTPFFGRPHPLQAALQGLELASADAKERLLQGLQAVSEDLGEHVDRVPHDRMSGPAREFATQLLRSNADALVSHLSRMVNL
jgi:hypothetical protein